MRQRATTPLASKMYQLAWIVCMSIILIMLRLAQLQINLNHNLLRASQRNFLRTVQVTPLRGNIVDRKGKLLATNRPMVNLFWHGTGTRTLTVEHKQVLKQLETILGVSLIENEQILKDISYAQRYHQEYLLARDISPVQLSQLAEQFPTQTNLTLKTHFKRCYPHHKFASHIVGYISTMGDQILGTMGLEKLLEAQLKGMQGKMLKKVNSLGRTLQEMEIEHALSGKEIKTTLDLDLQSIIEQVFPCDARGTFILLDPQDGSILALLSRPSFDPSIFLEPLSKTQWLEIQEQQPFLNRAFNSVYPLGSIFKLVTVSAALEHGLITTQTVWNCRGYYEFGRRKYWCNNRWGHGVVDTAQAVAHSCNPFFFDIARRLPIDTLADYANRFGLGIKSNSIFSHKTALIPTRAWKREVKGEPWWPGETLSAVIGQSYLQVTPIEVAIMISSIVTGYVVNWRVLCDEPIDTWPLAIQPETRQFLQRCMKDVVDHGSGQRVKRIKGITMYAKTSTAQVSALDKRDLDRHFLEHGWFAGYFSYEDKPPLTMVVLVENAGSARVAIDIACAFLKEYKHLKQTQA